MPAPRPHPAAQPHSELREVLPDLYFVTGTMKLPGVLPVRFSRSMTVVREGERLIIVNSVRLNEAGLAALDKLGKVTDVIRIAGNHGMDDPFYAERYGAKVSVVKGQRYIAGFRSNAEPYFTAQQELEPSSSLPIKDARLHAIGSSPPEAILLLPRHGGTIISGDCLQNWAAPDEYFSWLARPIMKRMGFITPHNVGPAWLKNCKPPKPDLRAILELPFVNVLPGHGTPVIDRARDLYRPVLERVSS